MTTGDCSPPPSSRQKIQRVTAVQLASKKGTDNVVRFDPSVVSPESSMQLEEPMAVGEDEVGK